MREETNNRVTMCGTISSKPTFNHEVYTEKFYNFNVEIKRLSENTDTIRCVISDRLVDVSKFDEGSQVKITGKLRTFNERKGENGKAFLQVYVFVDSIEDVEEVKTLNNVYLDGFVCKKPTYRNTASGREITDVLVAVNRPYGKSDYIPCICWGRDARYVSSEVEVGQPIRIKGRIQSRDYIKRISDTETITKTAYEVSASVVETCFKEEETEE